MKYIGVVRNIPRKTNGPPGFPSGVTSYEDDDDDEDDDERLSPAAAAAVVAAVVVTVVVAAAVPVPSLHFNFFAACCPSSPSPFVAAAVVFISCPRLTLTTVSSPFSPVLLASVVLIFLWFW
jgi:hypothetical protein